MNNSPSTEDDLPLVNPVPIVLSEYIEESGMSKGTVADALQLPMPRLSELLAGRRRVTASIALALDQCFHTSPEFWLNMQNDYDLRVARKKLGKGPPLILQKAS